MKVTRRAIITVNRPVEIEAEIEFEIKPFEPMNDKQFDLHGMTGVYDNGICVGVYETEEKAIEEIEAGMLDDLLEDEVDLD